MTHATFGVVAGSVLALMAGQAMADDSVWSAWHGTVGLGVVTGPAFDGSDETTTAPVPLVDVEHRDGRVFLSTRNGVGYRIVNTEGVKAGVALTMVGGRDSSDDNRIARFEDIDTAAGAQVFGEYAVTDSVNLTGDVTQSLGGSDGWRATVGLGTARPLTDRLLATAGVNTTYASKDDMKTWFGVTPAQAAVSSLARYTPDAGWRDVGVNVGLNYALTDTWSLGGGMGLTRLVGDAADSPISKENSALAGFAGVTYRF